MKKRRLKKWVKILLTIITIIISARIYIFTAEFGGKAEESIFYLVTIITSWIWLLFAQFGVYYFIWES
ncbi:MAG: hypothetical protein IJ371_06530 [Clostridia bacterium]|nr:hypothetical protein [Clostridia bacterium]